MAERAANLRAVEDTRPGYPSGYPAAADPFGEGPGLREYWGILVRHKWLVLFAGLLGAAFGMLKASNEVPIYRADVTILVEPDLSHLASASKGAIIFPNLYRFYETQYELLRSRVLAERVVEKLGLLNKPAQTPVGQAPGVITRIKEFVGLAPAPSVDSNAQKIALMSPEQEKARRESLIATIQGGVNVRGGEKSQLVNVSYDSTNPVFAAEVANTLVDAYIELGLESRLDRAKRASSWLTERLETLRDRLRESEAKLQAYQAKEGMVDLKSREQLSTDKLSRLSQEYLSAQGKYADLAKRYGPKHPKLIAAQTELEVARRRLDSTSRNMVDTRSKEFELAKLEREVASNRQLYDVFVEKFKETDLSTDYKLSNTRVVDRAQVPKTPHSPNHQQVLLIWGSIGLLIGILLAYFKHHLDNKFRGPAQIEDYLGLPVLGVIPLLDRPRRLKRRSRKDIDLDPDTVQPERHFLKEQRSGFSEAVNHIRTGVLYSNVDDPPHIVLVTSAVQGEGKTTLATNLALSYAQLGRTLLVDADLRKPRVASVTRVKSKGGLTEFVAGTRTLQECVIQDPESPNLFVLRSGTLPPNPLELLSSQKLKGTLAELRTNFSHIVIDTAPVLPVSDAIVLGHIADATLLVIQADRTTHKMAEDALRRLKSSSVDPMGAVLTQVTLRRSSSYYYDGRYQYYYGGYYGHGEEKKRKSAQSTA